MASDDLVKYWRLNFKIIIDFVESRCLVMYKCLVMYLPSPYPVVYWKRDHVLKVLFRMRGRRWLCKELGFASSALVVLTIWPFFEKRLNAESIPIIPNPQSQIKRQFTRDS